VDDDPLVLARAEPLMAGNQATAVVRADVRDVDQVLSMAGELLDFTRSIGLLFVGCLHHIVDADNPAGHVARYLAALAPGSYLVISHITDERSPEKMRANAEVADSSGAVLIPAARMRSGACSTGANWSIPGWSWSPTDARRAVTRGRTPTGPGLTAASRPSRVSGSRRQG
jgi:hypothetical protein